MTFLLVAVIGLLWLLTFSRREFLGFPNLSKRAAFVLAFGIFEVLLVVITEGASLGRHLTATSALTAWSFILAGLLIAAFRGKEVHAFATAVRNFKLPRVANYHRATTIWVGVIAAVFGVLAVIGWLYPPSNADSLAYHLARVEHWIENRTVAHFATHYLAQIELAPLNSFNFTHLHLLSGGSDRCDGYVQWYAMLVCVIGSAEIARLLGATRIAQVIAAVICTVIPSVILEATSTQNNILAAAASVTLFVVLLAWSPGKGWFPRTLALGIFAGLIGLAKGTLPILLGPALALLGLRVLWKEGRGRTFRNALGRSAVIIGISGLCAVALAGPFVLRNFRMFQAPTGPVSRSTMSYSLTGKAAWANIIRSAAANFRIGDGNSGFETAVSRLAMRALAQKFAQTGIVESNSEYFLGGDFEAFKIQDYAKVARSEEQGANPWHMTLAVLAIVALAISVVRGGRGHALTLALGLSLLCGSMLFAGISRWNIFAVRYHIPVFVAFAPIIGIALTSLSRWLAHGIAALLVLACVPQLFDNITRSLAIPSYHYGSAMEPYFVGFDWMGPTIRPAKALALNALAETLAHSSCSRLGIANWILCEYPIWAALRFHRWKGAVHCVGVRNESQPLEDLGFHPDSWLRQEDPHHIPSDDGKVHLQFDHIDLAMEPALVNISRTTASCFTSTVPDVKMLPGGGWSHRPEKNQVLLAGRGSVHMYAKTARAIRIELRGASPPIPALDMRFNGIATTATSSGSGTIAAEIALPAGITRVELSVSSDTEQIEFSEVAIICRE